MPEEVANTEALGSTQAPSNEGMSVDPGLQEMADAFRVKVPQDIPAEELAPEPVQAAAETHEVPADDEPPLDEVSKNNRSWLGRKLADQEQKFQKIVEDALSRIQQPQQPTFTPAPSVEETPDEIDPNMVLTTYGEAIDLFEKVQRQKVTQQTKFAETYKNSLIGLARANGLDPDMANAVGQELDQRGNPISHSDPSVAAKLNFHEALTKVLFDKVRTKKEPAIPVNGKPPVSSPNVSVSSKTDTAAPQTMKLDDTIRKLQRDLGLSDERVQQILAEK